MTNIVTKVEEWLEIRNSNLDKTIGFVPTMGHLHQGHLSLCQRAKNENDITVVSIFVNPTQFNQSADYESYPRTLAQDQQLLSQHSVDYLFLPNAEELYPDNFQIQMIETDLSQCLEGKFRPGHFIGMLTVVIKLLNIIGPHKAYFGEKDYQQLLLVKKMVQALFLPVTIIACETIRADDLLALSSRNSRLNTQQRKKASFFPKILKYSDSPSQAITELIAVGFKVDYIEEKWQRRLGAVWLEDVRLIDNFSLS